MNLYLDMETSSPALYPLWDLRETLVKKQRNLSWSPVAKTVDLLQKLKDTGWHSKLKKAELSIEMVEILDQVAKLKKKSYYKTWSAKNKELKKLIKETEDQLSGSKLALLPRFNSVELIQVGLLSKSQGELLFDRPAFRETPQGVFVWLLPPSQLPVIRQLLLDPETVLIGHNLLFDLSTLAWHCKTNPLQFKCKIWDTKLAEQVLYGGLRSSYGLKELSKARFQLEYENEGVSDWRFSKLRETQKLYAYYDIEACSKLHLAQVLEIERPEETRLIAELSDIVRHYAAISLNGLPASRERINQVLESIPALREQLEAEFADLVGDAFGETKNFKSPKKTKEMIEALIGEVESTNAKYLNKIAGKHEILPKIQKYRSLKTAEDKLNTALQYYSDGVVSYSPNVLGKENTRASASIYNPKNLPNCYKSKGAGLPVELWQPSERIRWCHMAKPGMFWVNSDYSTIELRLMAYFSQDPVMVPAFQSGLDLHALTAQELTGLTCSLKEIKKNYVLERNLGKTYNFAIIYLASAPRLQQQIEQELGVLKDLEDVKNDRLKWLTKYSGVAEYQERQIIEAQRNGYVELLDGRRISFEDPTSWKIKSAIVNYRIQGTGYTILRRAIRGIHLGWAKTGHPADWLEIWSDVHDELNVGFDDRVDKDFALGYVKEHMEQAYYTLIDRFGFKGFEMVPCIAEPGIVLDYSEK